MSRVEISLCKIGLVKNKIAELLGFQCVLLDYFYPD